MPFGPIVVAYDGDVLRPRPWTLQQSAWAHELVEADEVPAGRILELGCGAGHIGLAAAALTGRPLVQVDVDPHACAMARANAEANGRAAGVEVRCGELDAADVLADDETFALVLADPPYVPSGETDALPDDPRLAVDGGDDGLDLARRCLTVAARHLAQGGAVLLQALGAAQVDALAPDVEGAGLVVVAVREHDDRRAVALLRRLP
jgi:methylase of polypeptide subunit release factors